MKTLTKKEQDYIPFPIVERRNRTQQSIEVPLMCKIMNIPEKARILEIGCGPGIALEAINQICRPQSLSGIDIDQSLLNHARRRLEKLISVNLTQGDARFMPYPDESFDVVFDFGTCYHISSPHLALHEISRVLVPGGLFIFETRMNQFFSHPIRSFGKMIPWNKVSQLKITQNALLWGKARKIPN